MLSNKIRGVKQKAFENRTFNSTSITIYIELGIIPGSILFNLMLWIKLIIKKTGESDPNKLDNSCASTEQLIRMN